VYWKSRPTYGGIFLTVAFGGKATQKFIENKYPCPLNTTEEGSKK